MAAAKLKQIKQNPFLSSADLMVVKGYPDTTSLKCNTPYTGQSSAFLVSSICKEVGLRGAQLAKEYVFTARPPKGDLETWMRPDDLDEDTDGLTYPSVKLDPSVVMSFLPFAFSQMVNSRARIQKINPKIIVAADKWALFLLTGQTSLADIQKTRNGVQSAYRGSQMTLASWWGLGDDVVVLPMMPPEFYLQNRTQMPLHLQDCRRLGDYYRALKEGEEAWKRRITPVERFHNTNKAEDIIPILQDLIDKSHEKPLYLAADIETSCSNIDTIAIAWSAEEGVVVQFSDFENAALFPRDVEICIWGLLFKLLAQRNVLNIIHETEGLTVDNPPNYGVYLSGQNWVYDAQFLYWKAGIFAPSWDDSMGMSMVMFPRMDKDLNFLSSLYCERHIYWKDQIHQSSEARRLYCMRDAAKTQEITTNQGILLRKRSEGLGKFYHFTQRKAFAPTLRMMFRGLHVNTEYRDSTAAELRSAMAEIYRWLEEALPEELNPRSPKQMKQFLFTNMNLPIPNLAKVTPGSTNEQVLRYLIEMHPIVAPVLARVLDQRSLSIFLAGVITPTDPDGCMRTELGLYKTTTFRYASRETALGTGTNLQNRSKGGTTEFGTKLPNLRKMYSPPPPDEYGVWHLGDLDLDSADMRIVAALSDCKVLNRWFAEGKKPYVEMLKEYYQDDSITKAHPEYRVFKGVGHGSNYLGTAPGIAAITGLAVDKVVELQRWYFQLCPEIAQWHRRIKGAVDSGKPLTTVFGAELVTDQNSPTKYQVAAALIPQSTVGSIIKTGMISMDAGEDPNICHPRLDVHDSSVYAFRPDAEGLRERVKSYFEIPLDYPSGQIIIPVDMVTSAVSWGDCG